MTATLTFLGAAGTVTGAKFLLEAGPARLLLDCGLFQGDRDVRARNWESPPVGPEGLAGVLLSHAHIDHSGYLPRLVRDGFRGPVHCSPGTAALLRVMLPDAARLEEEEAEYRNRRGATRYRPALPLFTVADAERALGQLAPVAVDRPFSPAPSVQAILRRSGHILGASIVIMRVAGRSLVYSGDLGRYGVPIMRDPARIEAADTLLVESTYGDRTHPADDGTPTIEQAVHRAAALGGFLLIPAFAVGRTQELLYLLRELEEAGRIPSLPVYLDSPMAIEATAAYARHPEEHDAETRQVAAAGGRPFAPKRFHLSRTTEDSKQLNAMDGPAIVLAGSGMATGGRILHHLRRRLPDPSTTVVFVGYQAAGTRGRALRDGAGTVRIFGDDVPVRAAVRATDALSTHADQAELLTWLRGFRRPPDMTYCVHGEPASADALCEAIATELGWSAVVAGSGDRVDL